MSDQARLRSYVFELLYREEVEGAVCYTPQVGRWRIYYDDGNVLAGVSKASEYGIATRGASSAVEYEVLEHGGSLTIATYQQIQNIAERIVMAHAVMIAANVNWTAGDPDPRYHGISLQMYDEIMAEVENLAEQIVGTRQEDEEE